MLANVKVALLLSGSSVSLAPSGATCRGLTDGERRTQTSQALVQSTASKKGEWRAAAARIVVAVVHSFKTAHVPKPASAYNPETDVIFQRDVQRKLCKGCLLEISYPQNSPQDADAVTINFSLRAPPPPRILSAVFVCGTNFFGITRKVGKVVTRNSSVNPVRFSSVTVWGWNGSSGSRFSVLEVLLSFSVP